MGGRSQKCGPGKLTRGAGLFLGRSFLCTTKSVVVFAYEISSIRSERAGCIRVSERDSRSDAVLCSPAARRSFGFDRLTQVIHALQWPKGFEPASTGEDYPHSDGQTWQNGMQGIANDDVMWFFTREKYLETVPFGYGLQDLGDYHFENHSPDIPLGNGQIYYLANKDPDGDGMVRIKLPVGFDHMSALTIQRAGPISYLYIPIQDNDPHTHLPIMVALQVNTGQTIVDCNWRTTLTQPGDQGAWCAYDSVAGRLYTSDSYHDRQGSTIDVYSIGAQASPRRVNRLSDRIFSSRFSEG